MLKVWPALDWLRLDESWPALEQALITLSQSRRASAAQLAASYLQGFRRLEGVAGDLSVVLAGAYDVDALRTSLQVTGPVTVKQQVSRGVGEVVALQRGLVAVSGVVSRVVLGGGRDTILDTVQADRRALGWMRVTHGKTCAFCAMLASRGPVYKSRATAGDPRIKPARFHDHCDCTVEPVYRDDAPWPADSLRFEDLWTQSTAGLSGAAARAAFRTAYEATL